MCAGVSLAAVGCGDETAVDDDGVDQIEQGLQTFPNQKPAFDYFVGKGLTAPQSAGIVGNLSAESGVDPTIKQLGGGPGRGIAQWQVGGRWDTSANGNVLDFAADQGRDPWSLSLQLDFIWFELTTIPSYGLTALKATTTAAAAATTFASKYEGCPSCNMSKRIEYAEDVLARFGAGAGSSSSSSSGGGGGVPCTIDDTGETGDCVSTSTCEARGNSVSTPGYCPGSSDIQCCTVIPGSSSSGGESSSSGGTGNTSSGGRSSSGASNVDGGDESSGEFERSVPEFGEGGCSTRGASPSMAYWLGAGLLLVGLRRRRA